MSRFGRCPRWAAAALLAGAVGLGAAGCVAVPVGGYGGYPEPAVVFPAPGVVIAPPPVIYRDRHYGRRGYGGRHYGDRHYGSRGHFGRGHNW
ncbi:MAG: hypothetical protein ACREF4_01730 [Gammaproteobacteria bacterium]